MIQIINVTDSGFVVLLNIVYYAILAVLLVLFMKSKNKQIESEEMLKLKSKLDDYEDKFSEIQEKMDIISVNLGLGSRMLSDGQTNKNKTSR